MQGARAGQRHVTWEMSRGYSRFRVRGMPGATKPLSFTSHIGQQRIEFYMRILVLVKQGVTWPKLSEHVTVTWQENRGHVTGSLPCRGEVFIVALFIVMMQPRGNNYMCVVEAACQNAHYVPAQFNKTCLKTKKRQTCVTYIQPIYINSGISIQWSADANGQCIT